MQRAKERRDARAEEEQLAEARRRSRQEVPGESSFGAFSSSSREALEREREPKAGSKKKEGKKEEKKEVKEERSRAFSGFAPPGASAAQGATSSENVGRHAL